MKNNKNNGKLLSLFCDIVYGLSRPFGFDVDTGLFQEKMPEIRARLHNTRNVMPKAKEAYCKLEDMDKCMTRLERALFEAERLILVGPVTQLRKEKCGAELSACAEWLAEIWAKEYLIKQDGQVLLEVA